MGFMFGSGGLFGGGGGKKSSGGYSYSYGGGGGVPSVSMPSISTDTSIAEGDLPKEAKVADLSGYVESERRRKAKNGVMGSFGFTGEA